MTKQDDPNPCHSHTLPTSISFSLILYAPIIVFGITLWFPSDSTSQIWKTTSENTGEHLVGFPDVYFAPDSTTLEEQSVQNLQPVIHYLTTHPDGRVRLEGHVDDHYSSDYGLVLSEKLAKAVKSYLVGKGISNRIETSGHSNARPLCLERTKECRRKNNRVHILVIEFREIPKRTPVAMSPHSHGSAPRGPETATVQASEPAQSYSHAAPVFDYPTIYFQRKSFQLDKKAQASLTPLAEHLKSHPDLAIRLIGHVDERHTSAYGFPLSRMRAEAVQSFLRDKRVKNAIKIVGYGKENPICFEANETCYRLSNQVEIIPGDRPGIF